jgi:Phage integrase family
VVTKASNPSETLQATPTPPGGSAAFCKSCADLGRSASPREPSALGHGLNAAACTPSSGSLHLSFDRLVRLYPSTGCRLQEITHLWDTDVNPHTKTIFIHEKPCTDCPDCRDRGGVWRPKTPAGTREISDSLVEELLALGKGLLFPGKHSKIEQHLLREIRRAVKGSGVQKVKMHRFRDTFAVDKLRDGVEVRTLQRWLGHETVEQVMEYCAWLDSQSEAARTHATREDIRYQPSALPAMNNKAETADSVTSRSATSKTARVILNDTDALVVTGTPSV